MRIQGVFTAAKLLALVAVVIAGVVHIAGGENVMLYRSKYRPGDMRNADSILIGKPKAKETLV
jgi:hypothetical protein